MRIPAKPLKDFGLTRVLLSVLCFVSLTNCSTSTQAPAPAPPVELPAPVIAEPLQPELWPNYPDSVADSYISNCRRGFEHARDKFKALTSAAIQGRSFLLAVNELDMLVNEPLGYASLFSNVHPNESLRKAAEVCEQKFMALQNDINQSRPLYNQLVQVDLAPLAEIDRYFAATKRQVFELAGVNLDSEKRSKVRELNKEIVKIGQEFAANMRDDVRKVEVQPGELRGLPEDFIAAHAPDAAGTVILTTDAPDYQPFMQYAISDDARLRMYRAFRQRGYPANKSVLKNLLEKRHQLATTLGYAHFADYITADKMIGSGRNAEDFLNKVDRLARPRSDSDYAALLARLQKIDPLATRVGDWQKSFLENLLKEEVYAVNPQEVRRYFSYSKVREGVFSLVESLFGITIRPWQGEIWHPAVEAYEIRDGNTLLGHFYLDMHPRPGKYQHAAHFGIRDGVEGVQTPLVALVCNFPGGDGSLGLLEHDQVETFLHEFGHLMHTILGGNIPWVSLAGTNTQRDFVEAPSQMLEEWVWDPVTLKTFATDEAGHRIPDALITQMRAARQFGKGIFTRHQLFYAALSLNYYNRDPATLDLDALLVDLQAKYSPFAYVDDTHMYASFGHLDGYSAIYYTYMWSLVIASDMFSEFRKNGLLNPVTAQHYRATVLAPGGSKPAERLVRDFLGRPFNFDAFAETLRHDGI